MRYASAPRARSRSRAAASGEGAGDASVDDGVRPVAIADFSTVLAAGSAWILPLEEQLTRRGIALT